MKTEIQAGTLHISEVPQLEGDGACAFLEEISATLPDQLLTVEIDLSNVETVDSSGLAALILLYKRANRHNNDLVLRVLNPTPSVQHLLELTRLHRIFEIVHQPLVATTP
jgi:anti-sigma B factor antagonist